MIRYLNRWLACGLVKPVIALGCDPIPFRTWKSNLKSLLCYLDARALGKQQCWHLFNSAIFGHKFEKICDLIKSTIYNRDKKPILIQLRLVEELLKCFGFFCRCCIILAEQFLEKSPLQNMEAFRVQTVLHARDQRLYFLDPRA